MTNLPRIPLSFLFVSAFLAGPVGAQLDIPDRKDTSDKKEGVELGDSRNGAVRDKDRPKLDLAKPESPAIAPAPGNDPLGPEYSADSAGAALFVFDQVKKLRNFESTVALEAVESVGNLGEPGLIACRGRLRSKEVTELVVAARVLMRYGAADDRARVAQRLRAALPARAADTILSELVEVDPILAGPRFRIELLDHSTGNLRAAAHRSLVDVVDEGHVALLAAHLRSKRTDTRLRATQLIARVASPASRRLLYDRLGDSSAKVCAFAVDELADLAAEEVHEELFALAFPEGRSGPVARQAAYALLALVEREDRQGTPLLGDELVPELLQWLRAPEDLVSGAAAIALSGIGFRSEESREMRWLDREVPHHLVRLASGAVFHRDFSALRDPAERRLRLVSGQSFGSDGPAWQSWWLEVGSAFRARRAVVAVAPEDVTALCIRLYDATRPDDELLFLGPGAVPSGSGVALVPRTVYLDQAQCAELVTLLRSEGVFSRERLPSRAFGGEIGFLFDVSFPDQGKRFERGGQVTEAWLERVRGALFRVAEGNAWQRHYDRTRWDSQRAFWEAESAFWAEPHTPLERARRHAEILFDALASRPVAERTDALSALAELEAATPVLGSANFARLIEFLEAEPVFGPRPRTLVELALKAGAGTGPGGVLAGPLAVQLVDVLATRFGDPASVQITRVLAAAGSAGPEFALADERALLRRSATRLFVERGDEASLARVALMLDDPDASVQEAAIRGLGEARYAPARTELHVRARLGQGRVRHAALYGVGRLGGEHAREVLILGLADSDPGVQRAALEAMAELADPETLGLLSSIFARGSDSHLFEPARRGLRALGPKAWTEIVRMMVTAAPRTRRDAALFLAEEGVPEAASTLISILTDNPRDARVAAELAILTGVDHRQEEDPAQAWWGWWDLVVHDDAHAWLFGAAEAEGLRVPPADALRDGGTLAGGLFLLELLDQSKLHLVERARRELGRFLGRPIEAPPGRGAARREWLGSLEAETRSHWQE